MIFVKILRKIRQFLIILDKDNWVTATAFSALTFTCNTCKRIFSLNFLTPVNNYDVFLSCRYQLQSLQMILNLKCILSIIIKFHYIYDQFVEWIKQRPNGVAWFEIQRPSIVITFSPLRSYDTFVRSSSYTKLTML